MEAKEKAKELVDKFYNEFNFDETYKGSKEQSKQCALIAVDEMIKNQNEFQDFLFKEIGYLIPSPTYWQKVKQEIEKL